MIRRSASILLVLLTSLVIGSEAEAQIFTLGVKGGGTFATISDPDGAFDDVGRRAGSVFGAYAQLGGRVGFRGEVLLVQKGFDGRQDGVDFEFDVDYVEIPALLVVRLGTGPVRPALYGGAAVGFERSCEFTARGTMLSASGDCDDPELDVEREELDAGAVFGAEVAIGLGGADLLIDGRYTLGLTTLDASDDPDEIKNRAFLLMAGLAIPIG